MAILYAIHLYILWCLEGTSYAMLTMRRLNKLPVLTISMYAANQYATYSTYLQRSFRWSVVPIAKTINFRMNGNRSFMNLFATFGIRCIEWFLITSADSLPESGLPPEGGFCPPAGGLPPGFPPAGGGP